MKFIETVYFAFLGVESTLRHDAHATLWETSHKLTEIVAPRRFVDYLIIPNVAIALVNKVKFKV